MSTETSPKIRSNETCKNMAKIALNMDNIYLDVRCETCVWVVGLGAMWAPRWCHVGAPLAPSSTGSATWKWFSSARKVMWQGRVPAKIIRCHGGIWLGHGGIWHLHGGILRGCCQGDDVGCHVNKLLGNLEFVGVFILMSRATHVCSRRRSEWFSCVCYDDSVDTFCVEFDAIACKVNVNIDIIHCCVVCVDITSNIDSHHYVSSCYQCVHSQKHWICRGKLVHVVSDRALDMSLHLRWHALCLRLRLACQKQYHHWRLHLFECMVCAHVVLYAVHLDIQ